MALNLFNHDDECFLNLYLIKGQIDCVHELAIFCSAYGFILPDAAKHRQIIRLFLLVIEVMHFFAVNKSL